MFNLRQVFCRNNQASLLAAQMSCINVKSFLLWKLSQVKAVNVRGTWRSGVLSAWEGGKNGQRARKRVKWTRRERGDWQKADKYKEVAAGERWLRKKRTWTGGISEERSCKMRSEEGRETTSLNGRGENERIMKDINSILLYRWPVRFAQLKQHRWDTT